MLNRWLATLERRFARYTFANITFPILAAMGTMFVLLLTSPGLHHWVTLDRDLVLQGQLWRLVTFMFLPPSMNPILLVFELWFLHTMGTMLEQTWGAFRYQMYWLLGWLSTVTVAMITGTSTDNTMMLTSLFFAFATVFPDFEVQLLFIFPVKVKFLAWIGALGLLALIGARQGIARIYPALAIGNYLLFFGSDLISMLREFVLRAKRARTYRKFQRDLRAVDHGETRRVCARCGVTDEDPSIDFRLCSCDRCGKPTYFCFEHARNH
jgi:membrane associated rhomboid family serine protease